MNPILKMDSISKSIDGIPILQNINLMLKPGDLHMIVGENGAGKSTLIKVLCGLTKKDSGSIYIDGAAVQISCPKDALDNGIVSLQQETFLFESMTVAENIYAYRKPEQIQKFGLIDYKKMNEMAQQMINRLGFNIKSTQQVGKLNLAQKRTFEIVRLSLFTPKKLIQNAAYLQCQAGCNKRSF